MLLISAALSALIIRASACCSGDQLHDLVHIFLYALKFPAHKVELSPGSGNLSARSDGRYLLDVDVNQIPAGFSQFDPSHPSVRDAKTTGRSASRRAELGCSEPSILFGGE